MPIPTAQTRMNIDTQMDSDFPRRCSIPYHLKVLKVDGHGLACDLWSIGVMAYALVSGEFPWYSKSREVCGQMIKYTPLKFPEEVREWNKPRVPFAGPRTCVLRM